MLRFLPTYRRKVVRTAYLDGGARRDLSRRVLTPNPPLDTPLLAYSVLPYYLIDYHRL